MSMHKNVITLCCAAAFALGLAACSSSDDPAPPPPMPPVEPMPSAYEAGKAAIMAAMTAADARDAYDAVDPTMITAQEAASLMVALNERVAMILADTAYERGKMAIMDAATVAAAEMAYDDIDQDAITGQQATELQALRDARIGELQRMARETAQKMALSMAAGMIDVTDLSTQAMVNAARTAIAGLRQALADAADVSDADKMMYTTTLTNAENAVDMAQGGINTATRRTNQMNALSAASMALHPALTALAGSTPTEAQLKAAHEALAALNQAIMDAADLTPDEKAPYVSEAAIAAGPIQMAQNAYDEAAEAKRKEMEEKARAAAQAAANKIALTKKAAITAEAGVQTADLARPFDLAAAPVDLT